jgi:hypothetical protein
MQFSGRAGVQETVTALTAGTAAGAERPLTRGRLRLPLARKNTTRLRTRPNPETSVAALALGLSRSTMATGLMPMSTPGPFFVRFRRK